MRRLQPLLLLLYLASSRIQALVGQRRHPLPPKTATTTASASKPQLVADLQRCVTADQVFERIVPRLTQAVDPNGSLASLILVRLSKLLVASQQQQEHLRSDLLLDMEQQRHLQLVATSLAESDLSNPEAVVEGVKAYAILSRLLGQPGVDGSAVDCDPLIHLWQTGGRGASALASHLEPHHLSGLKWAFDTFRLVRNQHEAVTWHPALQQSYEDLSLPFEIFPGCLHDIPNLTVDALTEQVQFRVDNIQTSSSRIVKERRQTAWQGDPSVQPFGYAGKSMPRSDWSPLVQTVRDRLFQTTNQYYDCCLLNLYPDGQSGMRYHMDPDQGTLWDYDTSVVSVGATRRFAFRSSQQQQPHSYLVFHGDVTHMFGDCQERFQHTVKKADHKSAVAARSSLVFKRTWNPHG